MTAYKRYVWKSEQLFQQ